MKDYLSEVYELFPRRRNDAEKAKFFEYVSLELGQERAAVEEINKNKNIVIGDVSAAKVVFTAHYDTPAASLVPNFMMPANKILGILLNLLYPLAIAVFSLLVAFGIGKICAFDDRISILIYLVLYFSLFFGSTRLIPNKHNKNDNTSGVAAVMSLASKYSDGKAAFLLFDNEEKGLLGSKAFYKKHSKMMENKLVINLDCVGNGENMVFIFKDKAEESDVYPLMRAAFEPKDDRYSVHYIPFKKAIGNSDYKSFPCSVGVMAACKGKRVRFITGRIHTSRDTVADSQNISFLCTRFSAFIDKI